MTSLWLYQRLPHFKVLPKPLLSRSSFNSKKIFRERFNKRNQKQIVLGGWVSVENDIFLFFSSSFLQSFWTIWNNSFSLSHQFSDHLAWYVEHFLQKNLETFSCQKEEVSSLFRKEIRMHTSKRLITLPWVNYYPAKPTPYMNI